MAYHKLPSPQDRIGRYDAAAGAGIQTVGVLAGIGVKAKIITAATVTAVAIGSVATYNHVTRSRQVSRPAQQIGTQQVSQGPSERPSIPPENIDREREMTSAEDTASTYYNELDVEPSGI